MFEVDRDHSPVRRVLVATQVNARAAGADRRVLGIARLDHRHDRSRHSRAIGQLQVMQLIVVVSTAIGANQQIPAVLGDRAVHNPGWVIEPLIDQLVGRLGRAQAVIVDGLPRERRFEHLVRGRLGVAGVEETARVLRPRQIRKAHPAHFILAVLTRDEVADVDGLPVCAAYGAGIRDERRIRRRRVVRERHRAVRRERIWIDRHGLDAAGPGPHVDRRLPLQPAVTRVEQRAVFDHRHAGARVVPQLGEAGDQRLTMGQGVEVGAGDRILRGHPLGDLG